MVCLLAARGQEPPPELWASPNEPDWCVKLFCVATDKTEHPPDPCPEDEAVDESGSRRGRDEHTPRPPLQHQAAQGPCFEMLI